MIQDYQEPVTICNNQFSTFSNVKSSDYLKSYIYPFPKSYWDNQFHQLENNLYTYKNYHKTERLYYGTNWDKVLNKHHRSITVRDILF